MKFISKIITGRSETTRTFEAVKTWRVSWRSVSRSSYGVFADVYSEFEVFTDKKEADAFAKALQDAHKLLKNSGNVNIVQVSENE